MEAPREAGCEGIWMIWKAYQGAVVLFFLFANVYWEWGAGGLAAGVMGGMVAWYSSVAIGRILWRMGHGPRFGLEEAPSISLLFVPSGVRPEQRSTRSHLSDQP